MDAIFDVNAVRSLMAEMVKAEFTTHYAYRVYAETFRDLSRDSVAEHFEEHSEDEMEHAGFLVRRMSVMSDSGVKVPGADAPPAETDPQRIIEHMVRLERKGIENWKKLRDLVGDDPMYVTIEEYMAKEQEHLDELMQLQSAQSSPAVDSAFLIPSIASRVADSIGRTSVIRKNKKGEYCVKSESNPDWSGGCYSTKEEAEERLKQVEMFKHMKKGRKKSKK